MILVPDRYKEVFDKSKGYAGLMGLSVGKLAFSHPTLLRAYAAFMQDHFSESVFLIADHPKIHNIRALEGASWEEAERRVNIAGNDMQRSLEKVVSSFPSVRIARWTDFHDIVYTHNFQVILQEFDGEFKRRVDTITMAFLELPANKAKWKSRASPPLEIARRYVLEELALLTAIPFAFKLPLCEIYPGRNEIQEDLQSKKFRGLNGRLLVKPDFVFMEAYYEPLHTSS